MQYGLNPLSEELEEVILVESPFKTSIETPLSTQTFSAVEIETYPGGNKDITIVIQLFVQLNKKLFQGFHHLLGHLQW